MSSRKAGAISNSKTADAELAKLREEVGALTQQIKRRDQEIQDLNHQIQDQKREIQDWQRRYKIVTEDHKTHKAGVSSKLEQVAADYEDEIGGVKSDANKLRRQRDQERKNCLIAKKKLVILENKLVLSERARLAALSELERCAQLETEVAALVDRFEEASKAAANVGEGSLAVFADRRMRVERESALEDRVTSLTSQLQTCSTDFGRERQSIKDEYERELNQVMGLLEKRTDELATAQDSKGSLEVKVESVEAELSRKMSYVTELEDKMERQERHHGSAKQRVLQLESKLAQKDREVSTAKKQAKELEMELEKQRAEFVEYEEKHARLVKTEQAETRKARLEATKLRRESGAREKEIDDLSTQLASANRSLRNEMRLKRDIEGELNAVRAGITKSSAFMHAASSLVIRIPRPSRLPPLEKHHYASPTESALHHREDSGKEGSRTRAASGSSRPTSLDRKRSAASHLDSVAKAPMGAPSGGGHRTGEQGIGRLTQRPGRQGTGTLQALPDAVPQLFPEPTPSKPYSTKGKRR